eukprot:TRINITY_DN58477_c0_g1_i1.p1 TRINITY_DN58477_c0_g1~~TRINITY_DN58477_c0_g1_i1.p1  ORF type:complete len:314 (-),score=31.35 TRINITY_DN58477_c0_g1_i1:150-1091(-)
MELQSAPLPQLLDSYAVQIEALRDRLPADKKRAADDLVLLRYLLSYRDAIPAAAEAVLKALEWRETYRDLVEAARHCENELDSSPLLPYIKADDLQILDACLKAAFAGCTASPPEFPLYVIQSGRSQLRELMGHVCTESVSLWLTWRNEIGYWRCDAASRNTGFLVKQIVVMNLAQSRIAGQDPRFFVAYGGSSKRSEWLHPQLLGRLIVVNPPAYMSYFWALGRRLVSERLLSKVHVHNGEPAAYLATYFKNDLPAEVSSALDGYGRVGNADVEGLEQDAKTIQSATAWVESVSSVECFDAGLPEEIVNAAR